MTTGNDWKQIIIVTKSLTLDVYGQLPTKKQKHEKKTKKTDGLNKTCDFLSEADSGALPHFSGNELRWKILASNS